MLWFRGVHPYSVFLSGCWLDLELHEQHLFESAHNFAGVRRHRHVLEFHEQRLSG